MPHRARTESPAQGSPCAGFFLRADLAARVRIPCAKP
jgi:hypothetical protein